MDLEEVWRLREEVVFPSLFGPLSRGIFPLTADIFAGQFGQTEIDPRWLHYGVLEYGPTPERPCWIYVTSGYSNPWLVEPEDYDPNGESGGGVELMLATTEPGDWAIARLQSVMAFELLLASGVYPGRTRLGLHDHIPLGDSLDGSAACGLKTLVVALNEIGPEEFSLPSGTVLLVALTGITDAELAFAKAEGSGPLIDRLRAAGAHPVNDVRRASVL